MPAPGLARLWARVIFRITCQQAAGRSGGSFLNSWGAPCGRSPNSKWSTSRWKWPRTSPAA